MNPDETAPLDLDEDEEEINIAYYLEDEDEEEEEEEVYEQEGLPLEEPALPPQEFGPRACTLLHRQAMAAYDEAQNFNKRGHALTARQRIHRAALLEGMAAGMLEDRVDLEPSRSVLYRSAATLALEYGDLVEASNLVEKGLAGHPPAEIRAELQDVRAAIAKEVERGVVNIALSSRRPTR